MRKLNQKGYTLLEAIVSMLMLGLVTLLLAQMVSGMKNNITSIESTRGLYSVMENVLETYQIDVTRSRDLATGEAIMEASFNGRVAINEIHISRGELLTNGERIYIITIKTYYKDRPKHFIVDRVIMTRGVGVNAV